MIVKYGVPVIAVFALGFAGLSVARLTPKNRPAEPFSLPPTASFEKKIGAVGIVEASTENIAISVPVSGLVTTVYVNAGDEVRKGQKLFSLDDRDLRAELALRESNLTLVKSRLARLEAAPRREEIPPAEARVSEAEAQLSDAQIQLTMMESVHDKRAIRNEDLERRRRAVSIAEAKLDEARSSLRLLKAGTWKEDLDVGRSEVAHAQSEADRVRADLNRLIVTSPIDGEILQCKVRPGEYATAGPLQQPLILLGSTRQLNVRADVDERDATRVKRGATVVASVRGAASLQYRLSFVRFEPFVVPKANLTGDSRERVDTRVLQIVYALEPGAPVRPGQQMDVLIQAQ